MLVISNLHLPVLQIGAWAGMLIEYSRGNSFADALEMTFDGKHPCCMCKAIEKEQTKSSNEDSIGAPSPNQMILFSQVSDEWIQTQPCAGILQPAPCSANRMTIRPEVPPPRLISA